MEGGRCHTLPLRAKSRSLSGLEEADRNSFCSHIITANRDGIISMDLSNFEGATPDLFHFLGRPMFIMDIDHLINFKFEGNTLGIRFE